MPTNLFILSSYDLVPHLLLGTYHNYEHINLAGKLHLDIYTACLYYGHKYDHMVKNKIMFDEAFNNILGTSTKVAVLRVLAAVHSPMTGRAIERAARVAHAACLRALQQLSTTRVVLYNQYGKERLYQLNRNSILASHGLLPLFQSETLRREQLFIHIKQWLKRSKLSVLHASVYGSVARRQDRLGSDLDLLIVVATIKEKEELLERWLQVEQNVNDKFSVRISPYIVTKQELDHRFRAGDHLIKSAVRDGFTLVGKTLIELSHEKVHR